MTAAEIRKKSRNTMESSFLISVLCGAIASSLGGLLTGAIVSFRFNFRFNFQFSLDADIFSAAPAAFFIGLGIALIYAIVHSTVYSFVSGTIQIGYAQLLLKQQDKVNCTPNDIFSRFSRVKEGFWQIFLRRLYTLLWSMLLIVPGIIKSYSYAMTPFIMAERPDLSASEAIRASRMLMKGHKAALFRLDLSFIGWEFLAAFSFGRGYFIINPYKNTAYAIFYRSISSHSIPKAELDEEQP